MKELPDTEYKDLKGLLKRKPFAAGANARLALFAHGVAGFGFLPIADGTI